ncbi:hypothetical protein PMIT1320_00842 [Prochlorococcus marinus str. MIT 1320]|nr:hypothetical protein PMIT1320_00842 [Prochlorococcus marinus str. MIT 1320]
MLMVILNHGALRSLTDSLKRHLSQLFDNLYTPLVGGVFLCANSRGGENATSNHNDCFIHKCGVFTVPLLQYVNTPFGGSDSGFFPQLG